ncbi:MAG: sulfite exporter TauE/SafE family protein [Planctomycetota bacterium]
MFDGISLTLLIFLIAVLYSTVGHGGASGYLAAMALFGIAPEAMKPAALVLNCFVSTVGTVRFVRAKCFDGAVFWPFALASIPFAFLGGRIVLSGQVYKPIVGLVLLFAAYQLAFRPARMISLPRREVEPLPAVGIGAGIGFLSGLVGVGGGIFLSPLLIVRRWADPRHTAGISAAFILVNSVSGLIAHVSGGRAVPQASAVWSVAAIAGGLIGSGIGSRRLGNLTLCRVLALVLVTAGVKMIAF